jgi:NAD-dependent SIR2 family protein deacetylase
MFDIPNYIWKCSKCGEELDAHQDEEFPQLTVIPPTCPKCGSEMVGNPIIHGGPFPENPFKKY